MMIETTKYFTNRAASLTKRGLRLIALEVTGLQRAVYVLALFALLSSVLGLLRDRLLAHIFGASTTLDLYYAAFRIPDFLFVGVGALVSVYILIPELARRNANEGQGYIDTMLAGFSLLSVFLCIAAAIFAPVILALLFPKFVTEGLLPTLTMMTRIMLLQPILFGFSNIFGAITQSRHRYMLYSISPLLYNLGMIVGAVVFYPIMGINGLAWGVVLGAILHAGIQVPSIVSDGFLHRIPRISDVRALFETVIVSVPRAMALSMSEIAELGLIAFAALLAPGSIAIFNFAYNLQAVPLSIIGASYSVAAFPGLAAALAQGRRDEFIVRIANAARHVMFWSLPATALVIVLRAHLVRVILGSGAFNWTDTRLTAAAFALFAISLAAQGLMLLLVRGYYAAGRTFVPFIISASTAVCTIALGAASVGALHDAAVLNMAKELLRVADVPGTGVLALAFVYSFVSILGTLALLIHFEHRFSGFLKLVLPSWGQSLIASIGCGAAAYFALTLAGPIALSSTLLSVFARGLLGGVVGIVVCVALYALMGNQEFVETLGGLRARMRRAKLSPSMVAAMEENV